MPRVAGGAQTVNVTQTALLRRSERTADYTSGTVHGNERDRLHTGYTRQLRAGLCMSYDSNNNYWYPVWAGTLTTQAIVTATTAVCGGEGGRFAVGDEVLLVGPGGVPTWHDGGAITAVGTDQITFTTAVVVAFPVGSYIVRAPNTTYGRHIAQAVLWEQASVDNGYGGTVDAQVKLLTHANAVDASNVIGMTALQRQQLSDGSLGSIAHELLWES